MITAPTAPGRKFINRACDILVETEDGPAITGGSLAPANDVRITVLTDRMTGAQIRLDDEMLDFIADSLITPAEHKARRIQTHYDAHPLADASITIKVRTGSCGISGMTVEAVYNESDIERVVLVSCGFDKAGDLDFSTLTITGERGIRIA